jgi:hypothetical protein
MNELPKIDYLQKQAALKKVLESNTFKRTSRQLELLAYLVKQTLAGKQLDETTIADEVFHIANFMADKSGTVRVAVKALREKLIKYYKSEGSADPVWIVLPRGKYTPDFVDHSPALYGRLPSWAPAGGAGLVARLPLWTKLFSAGFALTALCFVALLLWLGQRPQCSGVLSISSPKSGAVVSIREVVQVERSSRLWYCRCDDYLVVQPVDLGQAWVQGRLPEGAMPSLTAYFGDSTTASGTRFSVFVLSTAARLPIGPLPENSTSVATAAKSYPIVVSRQ